MCRFESYLWKLYGFSILYLRESTAFLIDHLGSQFMRQMQGLGCWSYKDDRNEIQRWFESNSARKQLSSASDPYHLPRNCSSVTSLEGAAYTRSGGGNVVTHPPKLLNNDQEGTVSRSVLESVSKAAFGGDLSMEAEADNTGSGGSPTKCSPRFWSKRPAGSNLRYSGGWSKSTPLLIRYIVSSTSRVQKFRAQVPNAFNQACDSSNNGSDTHGTSLSSRVCFPWGGRMQPSFHHNSSKAYPYKSTAYEQISSGSPSSVVVVAQAVLRKPSIDKWIYRGGRSLDTEAGRLLTKGRRRATTRCSSLDSRRPCTCDFDHCHARLESLRQILRSPSPIQRSLSQRYTAPKFHATYGFFPHVDLSTVERQSPSEGQVHLQCNNSNPFPEYAVRHTPACMTVKVYVCHQSYLARLPGSCSRENGAFEGLLKSSFMSYSHWMADRGTVQEGKVPRQIPTQDCHHRGAAKTDKTYDCRPCGFDFLPPPDAEFSDSISECFMQNVMSLWRPFFPRMVFAHCSLGLPVSKADCGTALSTCFWAAQNVSFGKLSALISTLCKDERLSLPRSHYGASVHVASSDDLHAYPYYNLGEEALTFHTVLNNVIDHLEQVLSATIRDGDFYIIPSVPEGSQGTKESAECIFFKADPNFARCKIYRHKFKFSEAQKLLESEPYFLKIEALPVASGDVSATASLAAVLASRQSLPLDPGMSKKTGRCLREALIGVLSASRFLRLSVFSLRERQASCHILMAFAC